MMLEYLKTYRKLILVYSRLITRIGTISSAEVYELYREYLKLSVKLSTNSP